MPVRPASIIPVGVVAVGVLLSSAGGVGVALSGCPLAGARGWRCLSLARAGFAVGVVTVGVGALALLVAAVLRGRGG